MTPNAALIVSMALINPKFTRLVPIDIMILILYFFVAIFVGFYVKGSTNASGDFFLAGRATASAAGSASIQPTAVPLRVRLF